MFAALRILSYLGASLLLVGCGPSDDGAATRARAADFGASNNLLQQVIVDNDHWSTGEASGLMPYGYEPEKGELIWRSSWSEAADSVVLTLGDTENSRAPAPGQVAVRLGGRPVLLASGRIMEDDATDLFLAAPLRVEKQHMDNVSAPLLLRKIAEDSGQARFDMTATVPALASWSRDVFWNTGVGVRVVDNLDFSMGVRGQCSFYWQIATTGLLTISPEKNRTVVEWPGFAMIIQSSSPVRVTATKLDSQSVLEVQTVGRPSTLKLLTRIVPEES